MTHAATRLQQLAALAHYGLPEGLPEHDGRTTVGGQQVELRVAPMTPPPELSLEGYARQLGSSPDGPAVPHVRPLVVVEVEAGAWGRVELPRCPNGTERDTIAEW